MTTIFPIFNLHISISQAKNGMMPNGMTPNGMMTMPATPGQGPSMTQPSTPAHQRQQGKLGRHQFEKHFQKTKTMTRDEPDDESECTSIDAWSPCPWYAALRRPQLWLRTPQELPAELWWGFTLPRETKILIWQPQATRTTARKASTTDRWCLLRVTVRYTTHGNWPTKRSWSALGTH